MDTRSLFAFIHSMMLFRRMYVLTVVQMVISSCEARAIFLFCKVLFFLVQENKASKPKCLPVLFYFCFMTKREYDDVLDKILISPSDARSGDSGISC